MTRFRTPLLTLSIIALTALAACDATGLPANPTTPTANSTSTTRPRQTATTVAQNTTRTARSTATAIAVGTVEPDGTPVAGLTPTSGNTSAALDAAVKDVEKDAQQLRGLRSKQPVDVQFIPRDQLRQNLIDDFKKDYSREEARVDALEMWMQRLIDDRDMDLYQLYVDFYTESIAGYYDPQEDKMFVIEKEEERNKLKPGSRETLAHEIVHALQDQHYDLDKMLPDDSEEYDRDLARRSLVEGDATLAGQLYAYEYLTDAEREEWLNENTDIDTPVFDSAPNAIRESFIFPYTKGVIFTEKLLEEGLIEGRRFGRIDDALKDPPKSTEQILHPEKYLESPRDEPVQVTIPPLTDTLGSGWKYADGGTYGEFDADVMLTENGIPGVDLMNARGAGKEAERAAAGWDGGQYEVYENGDKAIMVLDTRWDDEDEATQYRDTMIKTFSDAQQDGDIYSENGRLHYLGGEGDRVFLITSTDREALDKVLAVIR